MMRLRKITLIVNFLFVSALWGQTADNAISANGQVSSPEIKSKHARLYPDQPPGKNILQETQSGKDVGLLTQVINEWTDNSAIEQRMPSYPDYHLVELACGADAVVIGSPVAAETSLTERGDFLFTDYRIHVASVAKGSTVSPGSDIVVTRPGGKTRINNHVADMQIAGFPLFSLNSRYLFFLRYLPETRTYRAFRTGTFLLGDKPTDSVNATDPATAKAVKHTEHEDAFMDEVSAAITAPCSGVLQKLE